MPTKADMRLDLMVIVGVLASLALVRLWAARHAGQNDRLTTLADAVNATI